MDQLTDGLSIDDSESVRSFSGPELEVDVLALFLLELEEVDETLVFSAVVGVLAEVVSGENESIEVEELVEV